MPARSPRRTLGRTTRRQYPGSFITATTIGTSDSIDATNPKPHDISAAVVTSASRNLINATHVRTTGQIALTIQASTANVYTRGIFGFGLTWINSDMVSDGTAAADVPSPFDDDVAWLWRKFRIINYEATSTVSGADHDKFPYLINITCRTRSAQPTPKHALYLVMALNTNGQANLNQHLAVWSVETGLVLR